MRRRAAALVLGLAMAGATPALAKPAWRLISNNGEPYLTMAEPDTDEGGTSLHCKAHSGSLRGSLMLDHAVPSTLKGSDWVDQSGAKAPWKTTIHAVSGAISVELTAKTMPNEESGGSEVEFSISTASPLVQAFARTGAIRFTAYGETPKDPPTPATLAARLVKACSK